ncbi:helix-turn-helix transcriptional regulator [Nitriliruptoraceae bacterium ZYF776]|nr:helix-turn-helix transcriptional regulator [Profundirhabdus halotolerans]
MSDDVKRPYRSARRAERAARTRAAIRDAAAELFLDQGVAATSIREVAARAGVGERTVYDAFGTKQELFERVVGVAIVGDERPIAVAERPEFQAVLDASDLDGAIAGWAAYSADIMARAGRLIVLAAESAGADPAMRRFADAGTAATHANVAAFVDHLGELGGLRLDRDEAVATALALSSPQTYDVLRTQAGFTAARYGRWLEETLRVTLLVDPR